MPPVRRTSSTPSFCCWPPKSAELRDDLLGDEAEVIEVGLVEHLEVEARRAPGRVGPQHLGHFGGGAAGAGLAEFVRVAADHCRPALELRFVLAATEDES